MGKERPIMQNLLKSIVFSGLVALAVPAFAQIHLSINIGPPPPRREVRIEAPRAGVVWVPGYYVYDRSVENYIWTPGRWQAPPAPRRRDRRGSAPAPPRFLPAAVL